MNLGLTQKTALVTASSEGIGRGLAKALIEEGAKVGICSRDSDKIARAAEELKPAFYAAADLSDRDSYSGFLGKFESELGFPDLLVINTSGPAKGGFQDLKLSDWEKGWDVVWRPVLQSIYWALPRMKEKRFGRIILSTSLSAKEPISTLFMSGAYRAGLSNFVKGLATELGPDGITVNAILPGWTQTPAVAKRGNLDSVIETIPLRRLGTPEDLGALAAFLCSEKAGYMTGQSILVDGGIVRAL